MGRKVEDTKLTTQVHYRAGMDLKHPLNIINQKFRSNTQNGFIQLNIVQNIQITWINNANSELSESILWIGSILLFCSSYI